MATNKIESISAEPDIIRAAQRRVNRERNQHYQFFADIVGRERDAKCYGSNIDDSKRIAVFKKRKKKWKYEFGITQ